MLPSAKGSRGPGRPRPAQVRAAWHDPAAVVPAVLVARAGSDAEHSPEVQSAPALYAGAAAGGWRRRRARAGLATLGRSLQRRSERVG